jgi:hypothetical protein
VLAGIAVPLVVASIAWACITVRGQAEVKRVIHLGGKIADCNADMPCVAPGDKVIVSATGAVAGETYWLHFRNYSRTNDPTTTRQECGGGFAGRLIDDDVRIGNKPVTSDISGRIRKSAGIIPESAQPSSAYGGLLGPALLCFVTEDQNIYTYSATVTVM